MLLVAMNFEALCVLSEMLGAASSLNKPLGWVRVIACRRKSGCGLLFFIPIGAHTPLILELRLPLYYRRLGRSGLYQAGRP